MKLKLRPEDASMHQMNDWLAELREDAAEPATAGRAEPIAAGHAEPSAGRAESASDDARLEARTERATPTAPSAYAERGAYAEPGAHAERGAYAEPSAYAEPAASTEPAAYAEPAAPTEPAAYAEPAAPSGDTVRAVIGDNLRMPIMWCEMGSCVSTHADPAALGEGDARARAIADGWRIDAFGRLACPQCQQTDPRFRAPDPVVPWDRYTALARTAQVAVAYGDRTARPQRF
jgi:hypothetical protein